MSTVLIACIAALAATAVVAVAVLVVRRSQGAGEERLAGVVAQINDRMESMVRDLSEALERAQEENRRTRVLGELGGSIDLDEVLNRTLEATGALPGVDAALVTIGAGATPPLVAAVGLTLDEGAPPSIGAPPDGSTPRAISVSYAYDEAQEAALGQVIRGGLIVPLASEGEHLGYIAAYSHTGLDELQPVEANELEELALRAGPAIENARQFREARQLADLDALTGLHNQRYFHETLVREVARAHRYTRNLTLIVLDLDDFKAINDRIGHLAGDSVLAEAAERVRDVVRSADVACRIGGDEFAVILPESGLTDADQLYKRLQAAVSSRPVGQSGRLHLSAGVTELRPDDDAISFFQRADEALYRAKDAGKGTVVAVTAVPESEPGPWPRTVPGRRAPS
ncbi:MAG: sensor domain-containing diguanylate cyclase [Actinobacteria bacterium]|nr:sensor domain-containing diguanylate cyclase [Actinomycetota bacterium]